MDQGFIDILKKLIEEQGKEALLNTAKCKAFLSDYTKNEYKKESGLLLKTLEAGVQKPINSAKELANCKMKQIRTLQEDHFLAPDAAADIVNILALVLRGDTTVTQIQSANNTSGAGKLTVKAPSASPPVTAPHDPSVIPLMKRGNLFLEDADWKQANEYFDRVLDIDPEYAPAYIGKLCAELKMKQEYQLAQNKEPLVKYNHYQKAVRFADANYRVILEQYDKTIKDRIAEEKRQEQKRIEIEKERIAEEEKKKLERERLERERLAEAKRQEAERIANEERIDKEHREEFKKNLPKHLERIAKYKSSRISVGMSCDRQDLI